jgi:DNA-binding IclR family transcriptional regulator
MPYKFSSLKPILDILASHGEMSVSEISKKLSKTTAIIHKYLLTLVAEGKVTKK